MVDIQPAERTALSLDVEEELRRIEKLVDLLDSQFVLPGTNVRIGLDPIIGLVPGIGDAVTFFASFYIVERLARLGLPWHARTRMYGNIVIDAVVGVIPVLGDVIDSGPTGAISRLRDEFSRRIPSTIRFEPASKRRLRRCAVVANWPPNPRAAR